MQTRWTPGLVSRPLMQTLASTKYQFCKNPIEINSFYNMTYDSIAQFENVKVIKNRNYLPLGFCYDKYINKNNFEKISGQKKELTSLHALVIDSIQCPDYHSICKNFSEYLLKDTINDNIYTWTKYNSDISLLRNDTLQLKYFDQNNIKGEISINNSKILFFSIPFDEGWSAKIDGKNAKINIVDYGLMGLLVEKGKHFIELNYYPPWYNIGKKYTLIGVILYILLIIYIMFSKKVLLKKTI